MGGRREPRLRELLLVAVGACLLSVVMNWPLILNLGTDIPKDLGDPLVQAWQAAWGDMPSPTSRSTSSRRTSFGQSRTRSPTGTP